MGRGGVGSITFDCRGEVIDYRMVLNGTTANCGGGRTPWNTWISCEEYQNNQSRGQCHEVDPFGNRTRQTVLGGDGGFLESFAYYTLDPSTPRFFVTEDLKRGVLRRFTPQIVNWTHPSEMLYGKGTMEYLLLNPSSKTDTEGTFSWTSDKSKAERSAMFYYPNSEGMDVIDGQLYFVSKVLRALFTLDLERLTYIRSSTQNGSFDGQPDQFIPVIHDQSDIMYFTEEGGKNPGVHGRDMHGRYYSILESPVYLDETSGLAFSPDARHMYFTYQVNGLLFAVTRIDGRPFSGRTLNIKYHNTVDTGI